MGTGVGEAMIIGAMTGAGTSAITGGDPLKGALMGAAGGGVGAGIGGALGGQAAGTAVGSTAAPVTGAAAGSAAPIVTAGSTAAGSAAAAPVVAGQAAGTAGTAGFESALTPVLEGQGSYFLPPDVTTSTINQAAVPPQTVPKVGFKDLFSTDMIEGQPQDDFQTKLANYLVQNPMQVGSTGGTLATSLMPPEMPEKKNYSGALSRFRYDPDKYNRSFSDGGITDLPATKRLMRGGDLGSYSDGGRLLKGPGDGMSDNIPARIGKKQPARLADGEFVVPADVVSGIGNGSTDAGARRLYAMMDKVRQARTGKKKQGREIKSDKYMPA